MNLIIDADLANQTSDKIAGSTISNNIGKAIISGINLQSDSTYKYVETQVSDNNLKGLVELAPNVTVNKEIGVTGNYTISYEAKENGGYLIVDNTNINNLVIAARKSGQVVYNMGADEDIASDLAQIPDNVSDGIGNQVADKYTINGNGYEIDGAGKGGIIVSSVQELTFKDVKGVDIFGGNAVENSGKLVITAENTNSTFGAAGGIKNTNEFEITAGEGKEITISGIISDGDTASGTTTINGQGTVNIGNAISQKSLVVASGILNVAAGNLAITDGRSNDGTINLGDGD